MSTKRNLEKQVDQRSLQQADGPGQPHGARICRRRNRALQPRLGLRYVGFGPGHSIRQRYGDKERDESLETSGHTYHFDGMQDQGRDREVTKYLVPKTDSFSKAINQIDRDTGLAEIRALLKDSMKGRTMIVRFLSLGPTGSVFTVPCLQITDSWYVAHSEDLLYRPAYKHFKQMGNSSIFQFLHSAGKMEREHGQQRGQTRSESTSTTLKMLFIASTPSTAATRWVLKSLL
jgi:hypothetical protein